MFDLNALGPMMASIQQNIQAAQEDAANLSMEGQAGGGMVKVTMNGHFEVQRVRIAEGAMGDREMLEDLLVAACNDAARQCRDAMAVRAQGMLGGMPLPPGLLDGLMR